jgi:hypothetical protein
VILARVAAIVNFRCVEVSEPVSLSSESLDLLLGQTQTHAMKKPPPRRPSADPIEILPAAHLRSPSAP